MKSPPLVAGCRSPLVARWTSLLLGCRVRGCGPCAVTVSVPTRSPVTAQGLPLKNARERMDVLAAYREVGSYRGAAEICGTTHKTVKRIVERHNAGGAAPPRRERGHNYDPVAELVAERVRRSQGRISAKRLLPAARTAPPPTFTGKARLSTSCRVR